MSNTSHLTSEHSPPSPISEPATAEPAISEPATAQVEMVSLLTTPRRKSALSERPWRESSYVEFGSPLRERSSLARQLNLDRTPSWIKHMVRCRLSVAFNKWLAVPHTTAPHRIRSDDNWLLIHRNLLAYPRAAAATGNDGCSSDWQRRRWAGTQVTAEPTEAVALRMTAASAELIGGKLAAVDSKLEAALTELEAFKSAVSDMLKDLETARHIARLSEVGETQATLNIETARADAATAEAKALRAVAALEASAGESAELLGKLAAAESKLEAALIELKAFKSAAIDSAELAGRQAAASKISPSGGSIADCFVSASSQRQISASERARKPVAAACDFTRLTASLCLCLHNLVCE
ncbi:hypothetical protein T492DRAFT_876114 [Pavlovales sp. CCMP2436]|nr:hypothetical protein T492DRAFT_876114 [Pavlovales sp. CCMP2436]